jgi:hypothetical protein
VCRKRTSEGAGLYYSAGCHQLGFDAYSMLKKEEVSIVAKSDSR